MKKTATRDVKIPDAVFHPVGKPASVGGWEVTAYYNEFATFQAQWIRNLMRDGLIKNGVVDERSIKDVKGSDLMGFDQCHFFAGIAGWSRALQLAGVPDGFPIWTGSCPCQPFSSAGKRKGVNDDRHLWPEFARLIGECRPVIVCGEQVSSKDGRLWLAGICTDLEAMGYAVWSIDACAAGVGSPQIRQRIWWGAYRLADAKINGRNGRTNFSVPKIVRKWIDFKSDGSWMGNSIVSRLEGHAGDGDDGCDPGRHDADAIGSDTATGLDCWADYNLIPCGDGKTRRIEPGLEPLVDGIPFRLADGRTNEKTSRQKTLNGIGNAIVPQVAAEFLISFLGAVAEAA